MIFVTFGKNIGKTSHSVLGLDERNKLELERLYQQLDEKDEINQLVAITRRDYGALQADMNRIIGLKAEDIVPRKQS